MGERDTYALVTGIVLVYIFTSHLFLDKSRFMRAAHTVCLWPFQQDCQGGSCAGCYISSWGVSHIIYYGVLSHLCPSLRAEMFILGVIWEILEVYFGYHNFYDILWNALGIFLGAVIT